MNESYDMPPARRVTQLVDCEFDGTRFILIIDRSPEGRVLEINTVGLKHGSAIQLLTADACELISALLTRFVAPESLLEWLSGKEDGSPASIIGAIVLALCEAEGGGGDGQA